VLEGNLLQPGKVILFDIQGLRYRGLTQLEELHGKMSEKKGWTKSFKSRFPKDGLELGNMKKWAEPLIPGGAFEEEEGVFSDEHSTFFDRHAFKIIITFLWGGWVIFHFIEGYSWGESWYFVCVTLTTVGYGGKLVFGALDAVVFGHS
jgi:hypothetical protein